MSHIEVCRYCRRGIVCLEEVWTHIYTLERRCDSIATPEKAVS